MNQMLKDLQVQIISPTGIIYTKRANRCHVKTIAGGMTILPNHVPVMTVLDISAVVVYPLNEEAPEDYIAINGGLLQLRDNDLTIIANMAVRARDIDDARAQVDKTMAEDAMKQAKINSDIRAYQSAEIELKKALNKLDVLKHRHNM